MPTNTASVEIACPAEAVFEALDNPPTHFAISPSLAEMGEVRPHDGGGHDVGFTMRIFGVPIRGTVVIAAHEPPRHIAWRMEGDLTGRLAFRLDPLSKGKTQVTYEAAYDNPSPVLKETTDGLIRRYNQREIEDSVANLKDYVEHRHHSGS